MCIISFIIGLIVGAVIMYQLITRMLIYTLDHPEIIDEIQKKKGQE